MPKPKANSLTVCMKPGSPAGGVVITDVGINPARVVHRAALKAAEGIAIAIKPEIPDPTCDTPSCVSPTVFGRDRCRPGAGRANSGRDPPLSLLATCAHKRLRDLENRARDYLESRRRFFKSRPRFLKSPARFGARVAPLPTRYVSLAPHARDNFLDNVCQLRVRPVA
ncbi:MAG: hypothetical protein WA821_02255 [Anaerolineales bacterium]